MNHRFTLLIVAVALIVSACSGSSADSTSVPEQDPTTTLAQVVETTTTTTSTPPSTTTTTVGGTATGGDSTLENPLEVGAVTQIGDWSIRVSGVIADATDMIIEFDDFNDPPDDGEQFFIATLEATYVGEESATLWTDLNLKSVGESNVAYETYDAWCGSIPDAIDDNGETFPGGTVTGNTCWKVSSTDADSLVMVAENAFSFGDDRVFISLDPAADPVSASTAADGLGGLDTSGAAVVGEVAAIGDWSIRVSSVSSDATDTILEYNDFNDPPADGEQFYMVMLEATYTGNESSVFWQDLTLKTVGPSNVAYESFDAYCGSIPDPIDDNGETFPGGTITGNTCWNVASDDADALVMLGYQSFSFDGERTIFSLDPGATPVEDSTAFDGVGISELPTVALGESADVGNWSIFVVDVLEDATEFIAEESPFNDPPGEGEQFFMVTLEATFTGPDSGSFWSDITMKTVGSSSVAYEDFGSFCGSIPDAIDDTGEVFSGGTITGNACWRISSADAESLILIIEEFFSATEARAFYSLR